MRTRFAHAQPDVAVDAGAAVPARIGLRAVVDEHADHILRANFQVGGQVDQEAGVAVGVERGQVAVNGDLGVHIHAFELQLHRATLPIRRDLEGLAVSHHPAPGVSATAAGEVRAAARLFNGQIVR